MVDNTYWLIIGSLCYSFSLCKIRKWPSFNEQRLAGTRVKPAPTCSSELVLIEDLHMLNNLGLQYC